MNNKVKFIALIFSGLLTVGAFFYVFKEKDKTQLHYSFIGNFGFQIIWIIGIIIQLFLLNKNINLAMYADFIAYIGVCFLPVSFLLSAVIFAKTHISFSWRYKLLFVIPTISLIIIWTNNFHHLFYIKYSTMSNEAIIGPYSIIHIIYSYGCIFMGLLYFLIFSIRNSGIFSKQALLIIIGSLVPLVTNVLYTLKIINLSNYWTPVSFSALILCCFLGISKYDFFNIIPIALRYVVDSITDGFIVLNRDLVIVDYNKTFFDMFVNTNIDRGCNLTSLFDSNKLNNINSAELLQHIDNVMLNKGKVSFEKHIIAQSVNRYFIVEVSPILLKDRCIGVIILLKDVTEIRKSLETITENQALLRKERHDFANHLNTLNAMYQLNKPDTLDRMGNYIRKLVKNSNLYNVPESGNACINALLSVKVNASIQKNIDFKANFDFALSGIDIDDVDLISIIGNIVDNAFDAVTMESHETKQRIVCIKTFIKNNWACISISNNGPKIPDIHLNKIFSNNFSTKSEIEGERGFGLYITKELVTKNKGKILVNSTELETEFLLEFQVKDISIIA